MKKNYSIPNLNTRLVFSPIQLFPYFMILFFTCMQSSCKIYRFTDASVDPNLKSFTVNATSNNATLQNPNAAANFTEKLKDKYIRETRLALTRENGDIEFTATILEYSVDPVAISGIETLAQNRLNITVRVEYVNRKDEKKNFIANFRDGENFEANKLLSDVENSLINNIFDRLIQQIFNKTFGNW